jgi:tetratricopeptide (TPR) repeat protein
MTRVAFHLRRRPGPEPASALLLLAHGPGDLVRLLARLGLDPLPAVFAVADGFLVQLPRLDPRPFGGVLRLRALAGRLFLPADADLVPALLPDEAADLVARRGLVFLPGGRVLEFDPGRPVPLNAVLGVAEVRRGPWRPLPEPEPLADQLKEVTLELPDVSPDDLLAVGGEGIGTEDPLPGVSLTRRALGWTTFGAGKALAWLGQAVGLYGLAGLGLKWVEVGMKMAPPPAESLLGRQEATLRDLLRAFRRGDVEQALRRALPLGGDPGRGAGLGTGTRLPFHNLLYSLANILGGSGGGGGVWLTEADLYRNLENEYRRQAELAAQRGDYRRAAFIYGKLLQDYRAAAAALSRGGLHRDAAAIYLKRLDDPLAAARAYEAAGDLDRALGIYRQRGEHLLAADLLRRAGEEEQALAEYVAAAEQVVATGQGHYQAGELLRTRAGREDLALPYYRAGWEARPWDSPIPCAIRLAQALARTAEARRLVALTAEAGEYLEPPGNDGPAAEFFNEVARLAAGLPREDDRDELRDLALTGLAVKLRQRADAGQATGDLISTMLGLGQAWPPPVVSDARFALGRAITECRPHAAAPAASRRGTVRARTQLVTAVCQASDSGDLFLGFASGEVFCYRSLSGEVLSVWDDDGAPVLGVAATPAGDAVAVLSERGAAAALTCLTWSGHFFRQGTQAVPAEGAWLCPELVAGSRGFFVGVWADGKLLLFHSGALVPVVHWPIATRAGLLLPGPESPFGVALLAIDSGGPVAEDGFSGSLWALNDWHPGLPQGGSLRRPVLSWLHAGAGQLEVAGVNGGVYVSAVQVQDGRLAGVTTATSYGDRGSFLAASVIRPGLVAAVSRKAVHWLRREAGAPQLRPLSTTEVDVPWPVACFRHHRGKELIIVCSSGVIVRLGSAMVS